MRKMGLHFHFWNIIFAALPGLAVLKMADVLESDMKIKEAAIVASKQALMDRMIADPHADFSKDFEELKITPQQQDEMVGRSILAKISVLEARLVEVEAAEARKRAVLSIAPRLYNLLMQDAAGGPVPRPGGGAGPAAGAGAGPASAAAAVAAAAAPAPTPASAAPATAALTPTRRGQPGGPAVAAPQPIPSTRDFAEWWLAQTFPRAARALGIKDS